MFNILKQGKTYSEKNKNSDKDLACHICLDTEKTEKPLFAMFSFFMVSFTLKQPEILQVSCV